MVCIVGKIKVFSMNERTQLKFFGARDIAIMKTACILCTWNFHCLWKV